MSWAEKQQRCFVRQEWLLVRGLWICAASGRWFFCNCGTWHRAVKQTIVMLHSDSSKFMFIKYVKFACFPEPVCSNSCCSRFKVSFTNASNMIVCNNYVWMVFSAKLLPPVRRISSQAARRKRPEVAVYDCYAGEGKQYARRFPEHSVTSTLLEWEQWPSSVRITGTF